MLDQPTRIQAWLADLARITIEIDAAVPPAPRRTRKQSRKLRPLWEE